MADKERWDEWVGRYIDTSDPVPVFETDESGVVQTKQHGLNNRLILKRSSQMDDAIRNEGMKVIEDWNTTDDTYDGLLYLMYHVRDGEVVPLYVGKAGKYGKDGERLSANIKDVRKGSTNKFARWGDGCHLLHSSPRRPARSIAHVATPLNHPTTSNSRTITM